MLTKRSPLKPPYQRGVAKALHGREDEGRGKKLPSVRLLGFPEVRFDKQPPLWDKEGTRAFVLPGCRGGKRAPGGSSPISCVQKTGTYKLLFCVLQEEPEELECVYAEILDPVVTSNSYYGNELVSTLTTYLGNDASTAKTAADLFAHRHTIRYHLDHSRS